MMEFTGFSLLLLCFSFCAVGSQQREFLEGMQKDPGPWNPELVYPHKDFIDKQASVRSNDDDRLLREDETDPVGRPIPPPQNLWTQSAVATSRTLTRFMNAARYAISFPQQCEYGNKTQQCRFGLSCWVQGKTAVDLCGGGGIWTCCVPNEDIINVSKQILVEDAECGKTYADKHTKIVGGWPASVGEHPWQAALLRRSFPYMNFKLFCGGSLINEKYVLTASHCVDGRFAFLLKVRFGYHSLQETSEPYPHEDFSVKKIIMHKSFDNQLFINDIALLELGEPVKFKKHIVPICLPPKGARFIGEIATVSGFGHEQFSSPFLAPSLKEVDIPIVDNKLCRTWLGEHKVGDELRDTMLCAGVEEGGKDSCHGDSGGPLLLRKNGRAELIGVVSWGIRCGQPKSPGVYTSVSDYVDWINENMAP